MATYTLISSVTVGSGGSGTVTFSSIPQTYTDLVLKTSLNVDAGGPKLRLNGDTGSNYYEKLLYGAGTGTANGASNSGTFFEWALQAINISNMFASTDIYIPNYTSSNYKSISSDNVQEANQASLSMYLLAAFWSNTAPITSITAYVAGGGSIYNQYSTFYLYGVSNA
jgi:hypothetical protein